MADTHRQAHKRRSVAAVGENSPRPNPLYTRNMQRAESSGGGSSGLQRADSSDFVTAEQLAASTGLAMNGAIELPQRKKEKAPSPCCGCVGIFHSKRFPCYYLCVMFIQLLMLLAMWIVQIEVDTGPWLSLVLMIGGIMIGMQVSQASTHWLAATDESDESEDEWRTSTAPWAIMARVQRNQWRAPGIHIYRDRDHQTPKTAPPTSKVWDVYVGPRRPNPHSIGGGSVFRAAVGGRPDTLPWPRAISGTRT